MLQVKSSTGKHESDIPELGLNETFSGFFAQRNQVLKRLKGIKVKPFRQDHSGKDAILPKLYKLAQSESISDLTQQSIKLVFALEKKFVLFGELHTHYSDTYKSIGDKTDCQNVYIYLATILVRLFFEQQDLNALNSTIRILDKVCQQLDKYDDEIDTSMLISVLHDEQCALRRLSNA